MTAGQDLALRALEWMDREELAGKHVGSFFAVVASAIVKDRDLATVSPSDWARGETYGVAMAATGVDPEFGSVIFGAESIKALGEIIRAYASPDADHLSNVGHRSAPVRMAVASRPEVLAPEVLNRLISDKSLAVQQLAAKRPDLDAVMISILLRHDQWAIRETVAARTDLDSGHVAALVADQDWMIRLAAAERTDLTQSQIATLIADPDDDVRATMAKRTDLTFVQRETLYDDECEQVSRAAYTPEFPVALEARMHQEVGYGAA